MEELTDSHAGTNFKLREILNQCLEIENMYELLNHKRYNISKNIDSNTKALGSSILVGRKLCDEVMQISKVIKNFQKS